MLPPSAAARLTTPALLLFFALAALAGEPNPNADLITAISTNNVAAAIAALDQGADPNTKPPDNDTPALVYCASKGLTKIVEALLSKNADVKAACPNGETALIAAARTGHDDCVRLLLDKGADVNAATDDGFTPLMGGSFSGNPAVVEAILAHNPNVNAQGKLRKVTPLILGVIGKNKEIVKMLLEKGADPSKTDDHGYTALRYAGDMKQSEMIALLKPAAEAPTTTPPTAVPTRESAPTASSIEAQLADEPPPAKDELNQKDADGRTALMRAAMEGRGEKTQNLLDQGANVNATDNDGWTALMLACFQGNPIIVKLLLAKNAAVNATTKHNTTALIIAAGKGNDEIVALLLAAKADVKAKDADGKTALSYARENGHAIVVEILKKAGAKE